MPSILNRMEAENNENCQKFLFHIGLGYDSISRNSAADTNIHYPPPLYKLLTETPELHTNLLTPNLRWNKITNFQLMLFQKKLLRSSTTSLSSPDSSVCQCLHRPHYIKRRELCRELPNEHSQVASHRLGWGTPALSLFTQ